MIKIGKKKDWGFTASVARYSVEFLLIQWHHHAAQTSYGLRVIIIKIIKIIRIMSFGPIDLLAEVEREKEDEKKKVTA